MRFCGSLVLVLALVSCGDDSQEEPDGGHLHAGADAATGADAAPGADANPACPDPTAALPYEWRPIDEVSTGAVTVTQVGNVTRAIVDASAGGTVGYGEKPFVYLDLATGTKVAITDVESYHSTDWDLAIKRYVVRINGGDSGPGGVEAAIVENKTSLDQVTMAPAGASFQTDDWATADCQLREGPIGEPETAIGMWYAYDVDTSRIVPNEWVILLTLRDGSTRKLRIVTYYGDAGNANRGAVYQLEWADL